MVESITLFQTLLAEVIRLSSCTEFKKATNGNEQVDNRWNEIYSWMSGIKQVKHYGNRGKVDVWVGLKERFFC